MKNQKNKIESLEQDNDKLSDKTRSLNSEIVNLNNTIEKQSLNYKKIGIILEKGIETQSKKLIDLLEKSVGVKTVTKQQKEKIKSEVEVFGNHINNMISWYQSVYGNNVPDINPFEIIELIQNIVNEVTSAFKYKNITFINHVGEPLHVSADKEMISYAMNAIATMLGLRSVTGNTMYIDVERSGKKCLVTFEDAGPGDRDDVIKDLAGEKYEEERILELKDFTYISFIMAKDLIDKNGGKLWASSIMEVGIKISFSLPIEKS